MINNFIKNLAIFTGISFSIFLLSFTIFAWEGPTGAPPNNNVLKPINVGTAGTSQRIEGALNVGGVLVGDMGVIPNATEQTRPTCNSSTEGMQWYDYNSKVLLLCNGTSWRYPSPFSCGDGFIDSRDGNVYTTVRIGGQCWMAENLNYATASGSWCHNNNIDNCTTHGRLYNHPATVDACPTGWRMPTHDDWTDLERAICTSGTCSTYFPYDTSTTGWLGTNEGSNLSTFTLNGNNSSGFTALMSGYRYTDGRVLNVGSATYFWSSSEVGAGAWYRTLYASSSAVYRSTISKANGFSVRCLLE